jgi:UDP-N-acetylmuramoyl-L-alanyl-D-glutamate-L-lysine ligase
LTTGCHTHIQINREKAIAKAFSYAREPDDVVVVAGKGRDCFQKVAYRDARYMGDIEAVTNAMENE